jgi:hypothetical protein
MSVELLELDVKVTGAAGVSGKVTDAFSLSYAVGDIPKAIVSLHEVSSAGSSGITELRRVFVGAEADKLKVFQEKSFQGQASTATITINPMGHSFTGNIVGPNINILSNHYDSGVTFIHPLEAVNSYTPHIYALANDVNRQKQDDLVAQQGSKNIFGMLQALMESRHKAFELLFANSPQQFSDPVSRENIAQLHARNMEVWPKVSQILTDSVFYGGATYEAFNELGKVELDNFNLAILNALKSVVFNMTEPFFFSLITVGDMFQSYYVPPAAQASEAGQAVSELGYFTSNRNKVENAITKTLSITKLSATCNKMDNLPLQQVIISGPPPKLNRADLKNKENRYEFLGDNPIYAVYPKNPPKTNGNNMPVALPAWFPSQLPPVSTGVKGDSKRDLDLNVKRENDSKMGDIVKNKLLGPMQKIIEEIAETTYKNVALASYTVNLSCLLDFSMLPGNRYKILDEDGKVLFEGFLQAAQHSASGISGSPSAGTSLMFYAVTFADFKLPE